VGKDTFCSLKFRLIKEAWMNIADASFIGIKSDQAFILQFLVLG